MRHEHVDHSVRIYRLYKSGAHPRAGGSRDKAPPPNRNFKNTGFVGTITLRFHVIYPSAEISHWNRLMTSILEF
jgi:hypothetical protein